MKTRARVAYARPATYSEPNGNQRRKAAGRGSHRAVEPPRTRDGNQRRRWPRARPDSILGSRNCARFVFPPARSAERPPAPQARECVPSRPAQETQQRPYSPVAPALLFWIVPAVGTRRSARARRLQLDIVLESNLLDQVQLSLDKIDALLFVLQYFRQQVARHVIFHRFAVRHRGAKIAERFQLQLEIALEHFFDVLADQQTVQLL